MGCFAGNKARNGARNGALHTEIREGESLYITFFLKEENEKMRGGRGYDDLYIDLVEVCMSVFRKHRQLAS